VNAQIPAEGILKVNSWGTSVIYKVLCQCGHDDCTHAIEIVADDSVTVTIYTQTRTNFWSRTRWAHMWTLLTKGYIDSETSIVMNKQVAVNYAETLTKAIGDVYTFKKS
jgi:hypothetical protein